MQAIKNKRERLSTERWQQFKASLRAKVEHPFRVIKRQFGYSKVRYRGLAKNAAQVQALFALSNLWMTRRHLLPATGLLRVEGGNTRRKAPQAARIFNAQCSDRLQR